MLSSSRLLRNLIIALGLSLTAASLTGCSLTPAYADRSGVRQIALTYAEPGSRLEQIVYQEMRLDFGGDAGIGAPLAYVSISQSGWDPTKSTIGDPRSPYQLTLSGTLTITAPAIAGEKPKVLFTVTRQASASYTTDGQSLSDNFAAVAAGEQAAHELAESLRLAILASYAGAQSGQ